MLDNKVNQYIANLAVWNVKLHNLHFNVVGEQFVPCHQFLESVYDEAFEYYDVVAEMMKMAGKSPLVRLVDYLEVASIKEVEGREFSCREAYEMVLEDMKHMRDLAMEIRSGADEHGCFAVVSLMEDHVTYYTKQIWFLESSLKK